MREECRLDIGGVKEDFREKCRDECWRHLGKNIGGNARSIRRTSLEECGNTLGKLFRSNLGNVAGVN